MEVGGQESPEGMDVHQWGMFSCWGKPSQLLVGRRTREKNSARRTQAGGCGRETPKRRGRAWAQAEGEVAQEGFSAGETCAMPRALVPSFPCLDPP